MSRSAVRYAGLALACGLLAIGCAQTVRDMTYPPQYRYMTRPAIKTVMWKLADASEGLQRGLREPGPPDEARRSEIVRLLGEMDAAAAEIDPGAARTNHPMIDSNVAQFRADLAAAKEDAQHDPPNYFLAGSVAGSCLYCHGPL